MSICFHIRLSRRCVCLAGGAMTMVLIGASLWTVNRDAAAAFAPTVARHVSATASDNKPPPYLTDSAGRLLMVQNVGPAKAQTDDPFHKRMIATPGGSLSQKWKHVTLAIRDELDIAAACARAPDKCSSAAALKFINITTEASKHEGRARLGNINRMINLAVRYTTDPRKHDIPDHWATPFETLESGTGDCEDYAIAKYALLRALNWPATDLRIVLVWDTRTRDYHAIEASFLAPDWLILDNGSLVISVPNKLPNYHPLFELSDSGVRQLNRPTSAERSKIINWSRLE
jgi:predicted transglutaminase-like cysteine proteinase